MECAQYAYRVLSGQRSKGSSDWMELGEVYSCMQRTCCRRNLVSLTEVEGTGRNFHC